MNPWVYESFWMVEAFNTSTGHRFTVDEIQDMPFVSFETAQANCERYNKELPHIQYRPVQYMKVEEKQRVQ